MQNNFKLLRIEKKPNVFGDFQFFCDTLQSLVILRIKGLRAF